MDDLIQMSHSWKEKADKLLAKKGLVKTLSEFGEVRIQGAYKYNLMMHGDIDISVIRNTRFSLEEVFEIFKKAYFEKKFRSYFIAGDWDDIRKGNEFPDGRYFGLKEKIDNERWKIDIWFIGKEEFSHIRDNEELLTISEEKRRLILEIKDYRNKNKVPIISQEIYNNIVGGTWRNLQDFIDHVKSL